MWIFLGSEKATLEHFLNNAVSSWTNTNEKYKLETQANVMPPSAAEQNIFMKDKKIKV